MIVLNLLLHFLEAIFDLLAMILKKGLTNSLAYGCIVLCGEVEVDLGQHWRVRDSSSVRLVLDDLRSAEG